MLFVDTNITFFSKVGQSNLCEVSYLIFVGFGVGSNICVSAIVLLQAYQKYSQSPRKHIHLGQFVVLQSTTVVRFCFVCGKN